MNARNNGETVMISVPSTWVLRWVGEIPTRGPVLDVAAGQGRHSILFLDRGHPVTAVDRDIAFLAPFKGRPGFRIVAADLESGPWPFPGERFSAVVVTNYLWRPLLPILVESLIPGGGLIYETFACGNERFGRPSNPDYLLRPGELLETVRGRLLVRAYEHGQESDPRPAVRQKIFALNTAG